MEITNDPVLVSQEIGYDIYNTRMTASAIARMYHSQRLYYDPEIQRGLVDTAKIERWAEKLLTDEAIFGTITLNFRTDTTTVEGVVHPGVLVTPTDDGHLAYDGEASVPDGWHRVNAVVKAVAAAGRGADFDVTRQFSVQIWNVPAEVEAAIFYWRNQEGKKADASRSKALYQVNIGQRLAVEFKRRSPHLGDANIETIRNSVGVKNPRLAAFNTLSVPFEEAWSDVKADDVDDILQWLVEFWDALAKVRPEVGLLSIGERQKARRESLAGSAIAIHGYIRLARGFYEDGHELSLLEHLASDVQTADGVLVDYMSYENPEWFDRGILVPTKSGSMTTRNARQTRRAIADAFAEQCGVTLDPSTNP